LTPESERKRLLNTIRTSVAKLRDLKASKLGGVCTDEWEVLKDELENIHNSADPSQTVAEIKDNPIGRQNVAPSPSDVAVSKEMLSDVPVSEYLKVPSIAREVRRANQGQEGARYG
jgi:hypothetical protein